MLTVRSFKLYKNQIKDTSLIFHQMKLALVQCSFSTLRIEFLFNHFIDQLIHHMTLSAD